MRTVGLFQFMRFVCNLPRIMRLFDFGRNYAKNYASIIRQGLYGTQPLLKMFNRIAVRNMKRNLDNGLNLGRLIIFGRRSLFVMLKCKSAR